MKVEILNCQNLECRVDECCQMQKRNTTSIEYWYATCLYLPYYCQEMPYLMLKHLGIYECGKHVLFLCDVPLPLLPFVCELVVVVAHLACLNSLFIGNIPKLNSLPKSHARVQVIELDIVGCKEIICLCQGDWRSDNNII